MTHYFFSGCAYLTPLNSDFADGRIDYRLPANVQTGGVEWPTRSGRWAPMSWKRVAAAAWVTAGRRMFLD